MKTNWSRYVVVASIGLTAAFTAGCADSDSTASASSAAVSADVGGVTEVASATEKQGSVKPAATGAIVKIGKTSYGSILQDKRGRTLYLFTKEQGSKSKCYGDCARAWPPLITKGTPQAGKGAKASKLGTTKRKNGKLQVTYNGHPLYFYVDEDEPNEVLCQAVSEFGGIWYVVNKNGDAITKS